MSYKETIFLLQRNFGSLILVGLVFGALSFVILVMKEPNFRGDTEMLIVQNNRSGQQDFYTLSRSAEFAGKVLSEAIDSELFINEVLTTDKVNESLFPSTKKDRLKFWKKSVHVAQNSELGVINISVMQENSRDAQNISEGIIEVLTTKNYLFRGYGQDIDVRVLTGPIVEKNPTVGYLILTIFGSAIFGILLSGIVLVYRHARFYDVDMASYIKQNNLQDDTVIN